MVNENIPIVTVDGPSGTGKGTVSQLLAQKLRWHFLDSGVLYRTLALAIDKHFIDLNNEQAIEILAANLDVRFETQGIGLPSRVILEGEDVTDAIRSERCADQASQIAVLSNVRFALLARQRAFQEAPGLVAEGRDMGTIVFPDAQLKIYLDALLEERAKRRYFQLKETGKDVSLDAICTELRLRDERDMGRIVAPLKPATDAVIIDTTHLSIDAVIRQILEEVHRCFSKVID